MNQLVSLRETLDQSSIDISKLLSDMTTAFETKNLSNLEIDLLKFCENDSFQTLFIDCLIVSIDKFLEFKWLVDECQSEKLTLSANNLTSERSFGLVKFFERRYTTMSIVSACSMGRAKANNLQVYLRSVSDEKLSEYCSKKNKQLTRSELQLLQKNYSEIENKNFLHEKKIKEAKDDKLIDAIECLKELNYLIPRNLSDLESSRDLLNGILKKRDKKNSTLKVNQFRNALVLTCSDLVEKNCPALFRPESFKLPLASKVPDSLINSVLSIYNSSLQYNE